MFSLEDTVVAVATPPGRGGLGVVRISGPTAAVVADALLTRGAALEPRRATLTRLRLGADGAVGVGDEVVVTSFPAPRSFTGQDVVEISAHGSPVVLDAIVREAIRAGARLARPGEFTLRSFLNGKRDLVQAEAVRDLIDAATPLQARMAFDQLEGTLTRRIAALDAEVFDLIARLEASIDFPDEGYHFIEPHEIAVRAGLIVGSLDALLADGTRGRLIREGATVVIAGRPNVGKSSLFNALAGADRAIVTDIAGTTRDLLTERVDIGGIAVTLVDTAGARETIDIIEREGVARAAQACQMADLAIVVLDGSEPATGEDAQLLAATSGRPRVVVANKSDRPSRLDFAEAETARGSDAPALAVSALTGAGMDDLRRVMVRRLTGTGWDRETAAVSNIRHIALLSEARTHLAAARDAAIGGDVLEEFLLVDFQAARERFDEVVGARTPEDVLRHIFERFCIGK